MSQMTEETAVEAPFSPPPMPHILVMVGVAGSGKSSWARLSAPWLRALSSDELRAMITDTEEHQGCSKEVFEQLEQLCRLRLKFGRPVIIDATNTQAEARGRWLKLARELGVPAFALWFDVSVEECERRQKTRDRFVPRYVLERQAKELGDAREALLGEGWDQIVRLSFEDEPEQQVPRQEVLRAWQPPLTSRIDEFGVLLNRQEFDVVGDVHGCLGELEALMLQLGWVKDEDEQWRHPQGRVLVFVGDLVDRGPSSVGVVNLVASLVEQERALLVLGNHDDKVRRYLEHNSVKRDGHIQTTIDEIEALDEVAREAFRARAIKLFSQAPYWALAAPTGPGSPGPMNLGAQVVIAHAAWKPSLLGQKKDKVRWFCLYGPTTGKIDDNGYPERLDWKQRYSSKAPLCITGHTAYSGEVLERHNTICLDTACVFGHRLSALRYPSKQILSAPAAQTYSPHDAVEDQPKLVSEERRSS